MHEARELIDAYWPVLFAFLTLLAVWRLARAAFLVWSGQAVEKEPKRRSAVDGARGSMGWAVARWLLLATVLAGATGFGLFWLLGRPSLPSGASFTTTELLDLLKIGLAVVGGLGAVVALAVAYRKQQVSEAAHVIATRQEDRERTKYFNERYGRAAEQLGHDSFAVRLAGVYAMAGLADDWRAQRQTCVDVLCGYLRTPYPEDDRTEREVRQAIITTLLDQEGRSAGLELDFRGVEFEDLDLSRRSFAGSITFDKAVFHGDLTDFSGAEFRGTATFRGARFTATRTSFAEVTAQRAELDFSGAEFTGELVDFTAANLSDTKVHFTDSAIRDTTLDFRWLLAHHVALSFERAELRRATLDLSAVNVLPGSLTNRSRSQLVLRSADAEDSTIRFSGSRLNHAVLDADGGRFADCVLEADLVEAAHAGLSTEGVSPEGFAAGLRAMRRAGHPQVPGPSTD
ncbi:uncharacterized protein YjbI with pentapeptide repeats [Saccharothrix tamanrassetensis]|uniref:Uncharacterized protein YjbI with pentapeptide repeats n=1 Tax=Saccharothrix tamanrassetensis TaxID=1051531 RepID=A0A841CBS1_9PSEU|nr:pentapeptide repeat-containing protein [Saccharothrix tamanrassetensis]MBB5954430.1 uncharacterized protein YjbI with pentapeptide repeats [Saccharothrix tamanrassetensis]